MPGPKLGASRPWGSGSGRKAVSIIRAFTPATSHDRELARHRKDLAAKVGAEPVDTQLALLPSVRAFVRAGLVALLSVSQSHGLELVFPNLCHKNLDCNVIGS
ncbi:hypothetical protein H920_16385 [Fukomys damarensis]|uniref:Uncharacterized protein n=1 Tax=Fukomys damarensis TaxID=885580 RepID=A0A091DHI2_FUKDA|nr:hypothetical protein H920_16385 [Fukomys damarensis]